MFSSKLKQEIESLRWKIESLEDKNKQLRENLERALNTLRGHLIAVKNQENPSDQAILHGRAFDELHGADLEAFFERHPDTLILDVRTGPEFNMGYIPNAVNIPIDQLQNRVVELGPDTKRPVVAYCASGARSEAACEILSDLGFKMLRHLSGGLGTYPKKLVVPPRTAQVSSIQIQSDNPDLATKVSALLDLEINPAVAAHGGKVALVGIQEHKVYLKFGGGCHGCGMVDVTLKQGITKRIREVMPEVKDVIDVTDHSSGTNPYFEAAVH